MALLITFVLGIFILIGFAVSTAARRQAELIEHISIALALGTITALALLEILPEAWEGVGREHLSVMLIFIAIGVGVLKICDLFVPDHEHSHKEPGDEDRNMVHIGIISTIAVVLHNVIEGMTVYSLARESIAVGAMVAIGVGLHNLPMGMMIGATFRHDRSRRRIFFLAAACLSTLLGGFLMHLLWEGLGDRVIGALLCISFGMMLYLVVFELIPHLKEENSNVLTAVGAIAGAAIIVISMLFE